MATKIVNKISFKGVGAVDSMTVFGTVHGTAIKTTQYGDSIGLKGRFNAFADDKSSEIFNSPTCYLPDLATDLIVSALESNGGSEIEFAFKISKEKSEKSPVGYVYNVSPIIEQRDPLAELQAKVMAALPALTAPETPTKNGKGKQ